MGDWLRDLWENLTEGGKNAVTDKIGRGWPAPLAVIFELVKDGFCILVVIGLFLFTANHVKDCRARQKAELCPHENVDMEAFRLDAQNRCIKGYCFDCERQIQPTHYVSYEQLTEGDCLVRGTRKVTYTAKKYPGITFEAIEETGFGYHTFEETEPEIPATCQSEGRQHVAVCTLCNETRGGAVLPIIDCQYERTGTLEPTCSTLGQTGYLACIFCYEVVEENEEIPCIPHTTIDEYSTEATYECGGERRGYCTVCEGEVHLEYISQPLLSEFFDYTLDDATGTALLSAYKGAAKSVVIPAFINGYALKQIPQELFKGNTTLESITVCEGVEYIGESAFEGCTALREVVFANSLKEISARAFYGCREIRRIDIPNARIGTQAFAECKNLRVINTGYGVDYIGDNAFYRCPKLLIIRFSPLCEAQYRKNMFDADAGGDLTDISAYVPYHIGNRSGYFDIPLEYEVDEVIHCQDGFYYYDYPSKTKRLVSVDLPEQKHIVLPSWAESIERSFFRSLENGEILSITVPKGLADIYCYGDCLANINIYFIDPNATRKDHVYNIDGVYTDPETGAQVEYRATKYYYAESFSGVDSNYSYWHYGENGEIVEYVPEKEDYE